MNLDTLPEDALLLVLGYLDTESLLRCRGVCRLLRDATLHPHLWRKRRICSKGQTSENWVAAATLRLAPCLGSLSLIYHGIHENNMETLLSSTNCAISELDLQGSYFTAVSAAKALARQAVLGRVKTVSLKNLWRSKSEEIRMLLDQLLHIQGLTSIILDLSRCRDSLDFGRPAADRAVPASLRRLTYSWAGGPPSLLGTLLQWHAATLEVVHFRRRWSEPPAGSAALLGALPHLRELRCPILKDMPALLQCPTLKSLYLQCGDVKEDEDDFPTGPLLHGVQKYLRQATDRLETLTLEFLENNEDDYQLAPESATNLLLCLAGAGAPSSLRSLRLTYHGRDAREDQPQLVPLASVLHRLGNLERLDLGGPPTEDFFAAMDGRVLPRLERLRVSPFLHPCPHLWAHGEEPRGLLARYRVTLRPARWQQIAPAHQERCCRYPRLHLEVDSLHAPSREYCCSEEEDDCHAFFFDPDGSICTLFSHPEGEPCGQEHAANEMHIDL